MSCIPTVHWLSKQEERFFFDSLCLTAEPEICEALLANLRCLPLCSGSANSLWLALDDKADLGREGYLLTIEAGKIKIEGQSTQGLYYGLSTLKLMLASQNGLLQCGTIQDVPRFANRGVMLDVSRGKLPTLEYLKSLVGFLADMKYNLLQLYSEDKLALSAHPLVGADTGVYTEAQIRELDACCRAHFIQLQPCIQTYSHMHGVLRLPGYSHLSENDGLFSLAAGKHEVYEFLEDMLGETLPWFSSKTLNINMDEAYDIGTGYTANEVEREGKGRVFLRHIHRAVEIARRHGAKTIILWGDIAAKYPELLGELPPDTIVADWNYNPAESYPSLDVFEGAGIPFWAAGGVSSWNSLFPRVYNCYQNLSAYSAGALEKGAEGFLVTDWGDYGHPQPLGLSLYGYMVGAQQAFWAGREGPAQNEGEAWPLLFASEAVGEAFRCLMDSNLAPDIQTGFKTMSIYYFFDDMFAGLGMVGNEKYPRITKEAFAVLRDKGGQACGLLDGPGIEAAIQRHGYPDENWRALFGKSFIEELRLSARMTRFTGAKGLLSYKIREALAGPALVAEDILALVIEVKRLYRELLALRSTFEAVWLLRAQREGIESSLSLFDRAGVQLGEAVKWLALQYQSVARGGRADASLDTYTAATGYAVLWTADFKNMWDRAYPWQ